MNITVISGTIADQSASAIVVNHFEGLQTPGGATRAMDAKLGGDTQAGVGIAEGKATLIAASS